MSIRFRSIAFMSAFLALAAISSLAWADFVTLDAPVLTLAKDYSEADYQKVKAVLERKDCKFLGGAQLNRSTSLRYGGDTTALNKFIEALSLCPNLKVHVNFYRPTPGSVECDWMVTQDAASNEVVVRINLASEKVKIEDLYLPPVKAELEAAGIVARAEATELQLTKGTLKPRVVRDGDGHVTRLYLNDMKLSRNDFVELGKLEHLNVLCLVATNVTDEDLPGLKRCQSLEYLMLNRTEVTDLAIDTIVELKRLQSLCLGEVKITPEAMEKLKERNRQHDSQHQLRWGYSQRKP